MNPARASHLLPLDVEQPAVQHKLPAPLPFIQPPVVDLGLRGQGRWAGGHMGRRATHWQVGSTLAVGWHVGSVSPGSTCRVVTGLQAHAGELLLSNQPSSP